MASAQAGRRTAYALALLGLLYTLAPDANAIEAFDGRIQAHGFGEMQIRALDADFAEEIDLSQWYNVFNLELEADILPDGWGPFDLLQAYVRVEARYDAIYSNGFGMFPSVSTFGNSSKRLPLRLRDALDQDYAGVINSNAQADPPGSHVFRVPEAGDLDPSSSYQHPRGTLGAPAYRERDPVGWVIEEITADTIDYQRDDAGKVVADPKNPMNPADLVLLYRREKTGVPVANPSTLDFTEAALENDPLVFTEYTVYLLDPLGALVLEDGEPVIGCGQLRPDGSGDRVLCRGLPENGSRTAGGVSTTTPPFPNDGSNGSAGSDRDNHHLLLDRGNSLVRDPLTGERKTVAELYGDVLFAGVDADGNLIPAAGPTAEGQAVTGFGSRLDGAGITDDPNSATKINGALPVDPPNSAFGSGGTSRLIGFNGTCSTNRTDTRDAYAKDADGNFEYDLATRGEILSSGVLGTCVDNRLQKTSIVKRRAFPGFDTLFDQEGADAELGVSIDAANPELADRVSPVSSVIAPINEILAAVPVPGGCPDVANGGLENCGLDARDERRFQAEQLILNEVAPLFRGLALERDDPAFYALENVIDWRFTTREIKGAEGGAGGTWLMGPWLPKNVFQVNGALADRANPFRSRGTPTVVPRVSSSEFANQTGNLFQQAPRAAGDRYHALDVTAFEMAIEAAGGQLAIDSAQARYITDEACAPGFAGTGCKVIDFVFPSPGVVQVVITGLDLSKATFGPDPIDPRVAKLDTLVALLGQTGVRLRRQREIRVSPTQVRTVTSQSEVGPYPNGVLSLGDFADRRGQLDFRLLERSGDRFATPSSSFGGDFSGILPCQNTVLSISRNTAPQFSTFEGRMAAYDFQPSFNGDPALGGSSIGCIPFTNLLAAGGAGELPLRPAADLSNLLVGADLTSAQGNYIPSQGLIRALQTVDFDDPQFNINQPERSWNRGASQSDTFELKEAYADMEFLDSRLWIRFGLQNIVWGKTELFRTSDQFNPQDLALASLPSLEESRIAVLSGRAVYSLYDVGPLEDVRVELAANFDRMKPADLGACGEPYTIDVVCGLTAGFALHGITGLGVAGVDRPPDAWNDIDGVEFGGRVEFRWDRFSFAIIDFYGYNDFPYPDRIGSYFRDVDTQTGRLRRAFAQGGPCENAAGFIDWQPIPATDIPRIDANPIFIPPPPTRQYQTWSGGNTRLAAEVDFGARRALLTAGPNGDPSALPTGADTADPLDDWVKHPLAYTVQGIGIDPGCLKPGGVAGGPNENRFDTRLAPRQQLKPLFAPDGSFAGIDANGDGVKDFDSFANQDTSQLPTDRRSFFNSSTMGQWERKGFSVDDALRWHPGNQQIFSLTCLGTVTIIAALDPAACAWTLFGSPGVVVNDKTLGEIVSIYGAGDTSQFTINFINTLLSNTKGDAASEFNNFLPFASLNRDARDGLTGSVNPDITGDDPFNPGDLDDWLTLGNVLSAQQQALLGCGPFFGTRCDSGTFYNTTAEASEDLVNRKDPRLAPPARPFYDIRVNLTQPSFGQVLEFQAGVGGLDVLGTEPSALIQSFAGFEGTGDVKGTYTRLVRREDGELLRVGDGTPGLDLTTCGAVGDPCVAADLLDASRTRFTVPASYQLERDALTALEVGLEVLQSNPSVPPTMDISDPACPPPPGMTDINCAGLEQIQERIAILQATGDIGPGGANEAEYNELAVGIFDMDGDLVRPAQFDRQVDTIGNESDGVAVNSQFGLIRAQEGTVGGLTRNVLGTFNVGGNDPGAPGNEDRSAFGRPFQVLDENDQPVEVSIAGSIVDGLEAFGPVNTHVTWSNTPQPGTLGNAGLVDIERDFVLDAQGRPEDLDGSGQFATEIVGGAGVIARPKAYAGGPVCTRFDPESPYADRNGIVKLPGCRGALSVSVNAAAPPLFRGPAGELLNSSYGTNIYDIAEDAQYAGTVEVVYEDFYDPRVDGCIFGPTLRSRDNMQTPGDEQKIYKVQAVQADGTLDNLTQSLLDATCFNTGLAGVNATQQQAPANLGGDFQAIDPSTDVDAFGNPELDLAADGTITRAALAGFVNTPSTHKRAEDLRRRYGAATNDAPQAFAATLFHPWASCMQSSALFGTAITGNQFNLDGSSAARSRPWAVDSASPAAEQRGPNLILDPEDGLFVLDAGVNPDARLGREAGSEAAVSRSKFLCDARTRDLENDFFEGTLRQDLDGDGLIAAGSQIFSNEMAAVSWNLQKFLVASSCNSVSGGDDLNAPDCFLPAEAWALDRCSFSTPQFCRNVKGILGVAGVNRNDYRAGGNGAFGRRDFLWHSGGEITLNYARRNVFGISADFAEDVTKTNWGMEFTWFGAQPFFDNNAFNNTTDSHALNLTVSVDRPTFINFLNANRTFFMNSQWFFQYLTDYNKGFFSAGPFNALFTFAVFTGYYQDRLLPQVVTVYDFRSRSGGFLPQVSYRFTEAFSITVGVSFFIGRGERIVMPLNGIGPTVNRAGQNAYTDGTERLLSLIRGRDEAFMRVRWTF